VGKKLFSIIAIIIVVSLLTNAFMVGAQEEYSLEVSITHNTLYKGDDNSYSVWGQITIRNNGDSPAYISSVTHVIQSQHSRWISIKNVTEFSANSVEDALVVQPGEIKVISYSTTLYPEDGIDTYRHRVIVDVFNSPDGTTKFFSDNMIVLGSENEQTELNPPTNPPSVVYSSEYSPQTTPAPTTQPPTTQPPTGEPTNTPAPTTQPPTTPVMNNVGQDVINMASVQGSITNVDTDITDGGYAVCVSITVLEGRIDKSCLILVITSKNEDGWEKIYSDSMNIEVGGGLSTDNTPLTFCFEGIQLSGSVEDYEACVVWKQGTVNDSNPIISRQCVNFHEIPAIDIITYGVIFATMAAIACLAVYIKKEKK